jgi:hypothetical protein
MAKIDKGYRYVKASSKSSKFKASKKLKESSLPAKVDLRPFMTPVENQGQTSSCTANAVVGACEYLMKKINRDRYYDLSRLFVYYNARWRGGSQDKDSGSAIIYAVESLKKFGVPSEEIWGFEKTKVTTKPNEKSYKNANKFKVTDYEKVETDLNTWKKALAEGHPIIFGAALFSTFDECNKYGGVVKMPKASEASRGSHGLHAMLCVGYSEDDQVFIVRNSWGASWGDKGYCYMPYKYLMNPKFNLGDSWILRAGNGSVPDPKETWSKSTKSVVKKGKFAAAAAAAGGVGAGIGSQFIDFDDSEYDDISLDYTEDEEFCLGDYDDLGEAGEDFEEFEVEIDEEDEDFFASAGMGEDDEIEEDGEEYWDEEDYSDEDFDDSEYDVDSAYLEEDEDEEDEDLSGGGGEGEEESEEEYDEEESEEEYDEEETDESEEDESEEDESEEDESEEDESEEDESEEECESEEEEPEDEEEVEEEEVEEEEVEEEEVEEEEVEEEEVEEEEVEEEEAPEDEEGGEEEEAR